MDHETDKENSKEPPSVSVVMPAYNHERFVGAAMDSVLEQTFTDLELIVIDDGSTDGTGEIVRACKDPRIRYYYQENQDAYNALNRGMELSEGAFISIINSDDVYATNRLQRLLEIQRTTSAACIFSEVIPIDDKGNPLGDELGDQPDDQQHPWIVWHQRNRDYYLERKDLYDGFLNGNYMVTTSNLFMTRALYDTVGGFCSLRYLHDYDYMFRILLAAENNTIYLDDEKLLYYRIHDANTLSEAAVTGREQDRQLIRKYLMERCPPDTRAYIDTAINRLIALEHELVEVHAVLDRLEQQTLAPRPTVLQRARKKLTTSFRGS